MALRNVFLIFILLLSISCAVDPGYRVDLYDTPVPQGGVAVFDLRGVEGGYRFKDISGPLTASFSGGEVFVLEGRNRALGIVAVGLETEPGTYELTLDMDGARLSSTVEVVGRDYGTERITLPPGKVDFDRLTLERIKKEAGSLSTLWGATSRAPLWSGPFIMPVEGRVSGRFGTRRILNNSPRSPHSGVDIAAPKGTPVKAANRGRVAFVGDFFFNGRFVVVDHGLGVFTLYSHLDAVEAEPGRLVEKGAVVGTVGATGRATGPHLHFSVKVGSVSVSPARLFEATERLMQNIQREASKVAASGQTVPVDAGARPSPGPVRQ
jgi:hypothetical protein